MHKQISLLLLAISVTLSCQTLQQVMTEIGNKEALLKKAYGDYVRGIF